MKIILDTHVFLWAISDDPRLTSQQRQQFLDQQNDLYLSVASLWEMIIKVGIGKLPVPLPASDFLLKELDKNRVVLMPLRGAHFAELEKLPPFHRDPFDRMIAAQARAENLPVMTADAAFEKYGVRTV